MPPDRRGLLLPLLLVGMIGLAALGLGGFIVWQLRPLPSPAPTLSARALSATKAPTVLTATSPAPAATAGIVPTEPPPATSAPGQGPLEITAQVEFTSDQLAQIDRILQDVVDMRKMLPQTHPTLRLVSAEQLAEAAHRATLDEESLARLARESRALAALGLLPPGYDLSTAALNRALHPAGGLYLPASRDILISGVRFGGVERWLYVDLLDRALLEDKYALSAVLEDAPECEQNPEPCRALGALRAGDAALAADQWVERFASNKDRRDVLLYRAPPLALPQPGAPPFLAEDATFLTQRGLRFARYLYTQGKWLGLDRVYRDPPQTSEQILHPRKYTDGEPPAALAAPAGLPGEGWQVAWSSVLGEWYTYLLLAVPADAPARLERDLAAGAAAGWKGDRYQVYVHPGRGQTALAARWSWDSAADAAEFAAALQQQGNGRFPAGWMLPAPLSGANCWQSDEQISCALPGTEEVLWLVAPDLATLQGLRGLYSGW